MRGGQPSGVPRTGEIHSTPNELNWAGLSDERRSKGCHDPVGLHQLLPARSGRIGIVFSVLKVLAERDSGVYLVGHAHDVCFDAEPLERRERLSIKLSDRLATSGTAS